MKKNTSVFFIVILLLTQFIYPFQVVQAVADNSKLSIKMVDEGSGLFNMVINKSNDYDEVRINIPDKTEYELFDLEHNVENKNVISIDRKYILKNIIPIQLFNWNNEGNQISFGIYKNQQLIEEVSYGSPYQKGINKLNEVLEQEFIENITVYEQNNHSASAPEFQRLISVSPLFESVESGNDALYRVILKTTGSQVNYTNVQLVIKLPTNQLINFQQDYKELSIADVIPVYDEENNNLVYNFAELKSGQTYETIVKLGTTNGYIKNNTPLKLVANLKFLDNDVLDLSSEAEVIIKSSSAVNITKVFLSSSLNGKPSLPTLKSDVTWKIKANIPHKKTGQMFIQTGKKIIIKDILPNGLKFVKATNNGKDLVTKINNNILVWEFDSPGFNEQESNKDSLFQTEIIVHTKIKDDDNLIDKTLENKANLDTTFIDGSTLTPLPETSTSIKVYKTTGNTATISGSIVIPAHAGPLNDRGGFANQEELNPNITVDDSAYLGFRHGVRATYFGVEQDLNKLDIIYTIDEHLYLDKMILPSEDTWFFGRTAKEGQENKPLLKNPSYKLKLSFVRDGKLDTIIIQNAKTNVLLGLEELGLKKGDRVTEVRYIFDNPIPMGFANKFMSRYFFTIEPGYVGEIKNQFNMIGESSFNPKNYTYGDKNTIPFNYREDMKETAKEIAGDRTVWVEKKNNNGVPLAKIYVELDDHNNGAVSIGRNKLRVTYSSPSSSTDPISESIESVILLPPGVTISDEKYPVFYDDLGQRISGKFEIIDKNYNNTNRQLVKFKWDEKYIRPSQKLSAEVDVDISLKAPSSLYFDVYGFSGDTKLKVPQVNNSSLTDTILQTDLDDLNQDGKKDTPRIKSSNVYTILNAYDLKTEKFVKGPGEDWSKFAKTTPGGDIDYRLFLTNSTGKDISSMTLIDVLPANGDLGITDNIARGSKFMPYLKGPIKLPTEWQGKVTVFL